MTAQRRTVLVVDDDLSVRGMLIRILGRAYDISTAHDGETALCLFSQGKRFDVVLCDVMMPRMDGAVFLEQLRRLDADQASRVIMLTANAKTPLAARLAGHYVVEKPFDVGELRELVDRVSGAARTGYFPSVAVVAERTDRPRI
jgi:CheY-like chemotaxis protein